MALIDWTPSPSDVGAVLRARTKDKLGNELGTFTDDTRPTDEQVVEIIETSVADIEGQVHTVPEDLQPLARRVAALGAACDVELTHFQEQINTNRSPYEQLKKRYDELLKRLVSEANDQNSGGEPGGGSDGAGSNSALPSYAFPGQEVLTGHHVWF